MGLTEALGEGRSKIKLLTVGVTADEDSVSFETHVAEIVKYKIDFFISFFL